MLFRSRIILRMGAILAILVLAVDAGLIYLMGKGPIVLGICAVLLIVGVVVVHFTGHRGFGGRGNTDLNLYIAVVVVGLAIALPQMRD